MNQKIIYWSLNAFFPTLQLFFDSGLSYTIDCGRLPGAVVGLDPQLLFRMTDCTHEEEGRITKSVIPEKFARSGASIKILEAAIAQRTSVATRPRAPRGRLSMADGQDLDLVQEIHTVVGLRLNGMIEMGYVWAKTEVPSAQIGGRQWGDMRLAGLRDNVQALFLGLPSGLPKPGGELMVVDMGSMIKLPVTTPSGGEKPGKPWI
ncbi:hypothetical protein N0V91_008595 [Didymella pomorum]|uniref:Uncharacterized protein n=1 Tax=Didymella pomorum TaxID=749634 RepID=A0A9W8Z980_9PLEO|nr:hypothetical protein N0V91_008595 [Didymella pomorum]